MNEGPTEEVVLAALGGDSRAAQIVDERLDKVRARGDREATSRLLDPVARAAANGSEPAITLLLALVDGHQLAHPFIRTVLSDPQQIEDAAQETLLAIYRGIASFEGRSHFTTWLYPVAVNAARQLARRERRQPAPDGTELPELDLGVRRVSSIIAGRATLDALISELPPEFRAVLVMREVEHLSYQEIADQLGIDIGTVKSRLRRSRERVAARLADAAR